MPTIDADAHVIECEKTWSYIENEKLRPYLISPGGDGRRTGWSTGGCLTAVSISIRICRWISARCAISRVD